MLTVVAMVLTLLGGLGVYGFFHLCGMVRDAVDEQAEATDALLAGLQANKEALESLKTAAEGLRLQGLALDMQIGGLTDRLEAHLDEAVVGPISIRGSDVPAALAAPTAAAGGAVAPRGHPPRPRGPVGRTP